MNKKTIIFAGTTEGRELAQILGQSRVPVLVSTATEYGETLIEKGSYVSARSGRLTLEKMIQFLREEEPAVVIDATHPYAEEVTENLVAACEETEVPYLRLKRQEAAYIESSTEENGCIYAASVREAVAYLTHTKGNILLTTGSKDLKAFTELPEYEERIYARVLSLPEVVRECGELGITGKHLLAMQGPFSVEMNYAMIRQTGAEILVTKESGKSGGFSEKCSAAKRAGIPVLVIGRPKSDSGDSQTVVLDKLREYYPQLIGLTEKEQTVTLVSIGPGSNKLLTKEAQAVIAGADLYIGANRMIETLRRWRRLEYQSEQEIQGFCSYRPDEIAEYIREHQEYKRIVIALSGDAGFYSGAKKLLTVLPDHVQVLPGVSSLQYFASKCRISWEDAACISLHGKDDPVLSTLRDHSKVFILLGSTEDVRKIARELVEFELEDVQITVGENLSYENERIITGVAADFLDETVQPLSVCLLEKKSDKSRRISYGIRDEEFIRDKVPMTKEEVRSIVLSKLGLTVDSVLYDIGAGTGSVAIEAAIHMERGRVYAIEKNAEAVALIRKNRRKFGADRLQIVQGFAPEALGFLPVPTHAFIGGSSGNLKEILQLLWSKNPRTRIVATAVTIETMMELFELQEQDKTIQCEMTSVSITKTRKAGRYHMLNSQNMIYVFEITKENTDADTDSQADDRSSTEWSR